MACLELKNNIISVRLITQYTDILYSIPFSVYHKELSLGIDALFPEGKTVSDVGTALIMDNETAILKSSDSTKVGGSQQKVTLEYSTPYPLENADDYHNQLFNLRHNFYSLLIEYMGGQYAIVRCSRYGDGFQFSSSESEGTTTNTITISNINGIQPLKLTATATSPAPDTDEEESEDPTE